MNAIKKKGGGADWGRLRSCRTVGSRWTRRGKLTFGWSVQVGKCCFSRHTMVLDREASCR